jgi:hypothetical protein
MARETKKKEPAELILLPEGRLINNALFERDQYDEKSTLAYKAEIAIPKDDKAFEAIIDKLYAAAEAAGLPGNEKFTVDGGDVACGIIDGDDYAKKRERVGKPADAYKGHWVIRAASKFNSQGVEGPGGMAVYNEEAEPVTIQNQGVVYNGCYGILAVTISVYVDDGKGGTGLPSTKFYLAGFQKSRDGERFAAARDMSSVFKPLGKAAAAGGGERRRRG